MRKLFLLMLTTLVMLPQMAHAQHTDIEFEYHDSMIELEDGPGMLQAWQDAQWLFTGSFPVGGLSDRFTINPGFESEGPAHGINPFDVIDYNVHFSPHFGSVLTFFDANTLSFQPTNSNILIGKNGPGSPFHMVGGLSGTGSGPGGFIGQADANGDLHSHLSFELSEGSPFGAYGILFTLNTTASGIADSDPFWIVWNYGMSSSDFNTFAVPAFQAIPEPGMGLALAMGSVLGSSLLRRKRRIA